MTGLNLVIILLLFSVLYVVQLLYNKSLILKVLNITYLFVVATGIYFTFESYKGWSTVEKLNEGYMIATMTVEPSPTDKGAIYYWAVSTEPDTGFFKYTQAPSAPRAYVIPYSKEAAQQFADAAAKLKEGYVVMISKGQADAKNNDEGEGKEGDGEKANGGDIIKDYEVPHLEIVSPDQILRKAPK